MKSKDKERLQTDLIKYCTQIGIPTNELPKLVMERKEYNTIRKAYRCRRIRENQYCGECLRVAKTIYIDMNCPHYKIRTYITKYGPRGAKYIKCYSKIVKATYKHKLHCLVH
jgi:hypothetical protein